jgi:predicted methyltransferase
MKERKLEKILEKNGAVYFTDEKGNIYVEKGEAKHILSVFDGHLYKLKLFKGIPILEIDGLRMHLVKEFETPLDYSREIAGRLGIKSGDIVLDTCMGLGYTAIEASKAKRVVTFEMNPPVLRLAEWNPWSRGLFTKRIEIHLGDVAEEIRQLDDDCFSVIIHDPPRFSRAPQLYSVSFYKELHRVAKPGARIFHYVGSLGRGKGRKIAEEVKKRLRKSGFADIKYDERLQGLLFRKPAAPRL